MVKYFLILHSWILRIEGLHNTIILQLGESTKWLSFKATPLTTSMSKNETLLKIKWIELAQNCTLFSFILVLKKCSHVDRPFHHLQSLMMVNFACIIDN